jgi:hydrogenase nickel incorporation protein HypA/HybF
MHELSVTQEVLNIAVEKAQKAKASKIIRIDLVIGEMSGVLDDSVQFYFDFLSKDSIASGASLAFKRVPMQVRCKHCGNIFLPGKQSWSCPQCQEWEVEVLAGREFYLESIEVE